MNDDWKQRLSAQFTKEMDTYLERVITAMFNKSAIPHIYQSFKKFDDNLSEIQDSFSILKTRAEDIRLRRESARNMVLNQPMWEGQGGGVGRPFFESDVIPHAREKQSLAMKRRDQCEEFSRRERDEAKLNAKEKHTEVLIV